MSSTVSVSAVLRESPTRLEAHLSVKNDPPPSLTIREMSKHGDFVRTVVCKPNTITLLLSSAAEDLADLRHALAGRATSATVSLRCAGREMHPSEVYSFSSHSALFERATVREALLLAGAPEWAAENLLLESGLQQHSASPVRTLDECAVRRLALICSLFSKATVVYWESPFAPLTSAWVERMATVLLVQAARAGKIFVATGVVRLPTAWNDSKLVCVEALQPWKRRKKSFSTAAEPGVKDTVAQMRELMDAVRQVEESANLLITRPMMIKLGAVRTAAQPELSASEKISNPETAELMEKERSAPFQGVFAAIHASANAQAAVADASAATKNRGGRNSTSRSLLQPSILEKLSHRSVVYRWTRWSLWRLASRVSTAKYGNVVCAGKLSLHTERQKVMTHLIRPLLFVLTLLCVIRFFG